MIDGFAPVPRLILPGRRAKGRKDPRCRLATTNAELCSSRLAKVARKNVTVCDHL